MPVEYPQRMPNEYLHLHECHLWAEIDLVASLWARIGRTRRRFYNTERESGQVEHREVEDVEEAKVKEEPGGRKEIEKLKWAKFENQTSQRVKEVKRVAYLDTVQFIFFKIINTAQLH